MTPDIPSIPLAYAFDDVLLRPARTAAKSRRHVDVATMLTPRIALAVPIVSANTPWCTEARMAIAMAQQGGIGFVHRMASSDAQAGEVRAVKQAEFDPVRFPGASVDADGLLRVGAAVGVKGDYLDRAKKLVEKGADVLVVDVAHGHATYVVDAIAALKRALPDVEIIAGNVATREGAVELIAAGACAIKVGIGPGSVCSTRVVTGVGVPQLSAILECAAAAREAGATVIADGGIRTSGDIVKALAAGASCVMLGKLLARAEESSAETVEHAGERYKITTGFVTLGVDLTIRRLAGEPIDAAAFKHYLPEGVEATFAYAGPVAEVMAKLLSGVRSGLSYCGSMSLCELRDRARFVQVIKAGGDEGRPHVQDGVPALHPDYAQRFVGDARCTG